MATSSITKAFIVRDMEAFKRLKEELDNAPPPKRVAKAPSLEKGREKLATFVFR